MELARCSKAKTDQKIAGGAVKTISLHGSVLFCRFKITVFHFDRGKIADSIVPAVLSHCNELVD